MHTLIHSLTHSHTRTFTHTQTYSITHLHSHLHSHTHTVSSILHTHTLTHSHTHLVDLRTAGGCTLFPPAYHTALRPRDYRKLSLRMRRSYNHPEVPRAGGQVTAGTQCTRGRSVVSRSGPSPCACALACLSCRRAVSVYTLCARLCSEQAP